ncbi:MAG: hypothetical protein NTW78_08115 [Campylobacterales bacterium]|nr:hypothetical protein [Campylobacterales bacterium]
MPDFAEPVTFTFIAVTVAVIFVIIGVGIALVKAGKKSRNSEGL